jgi:osmotically-inducible protein OsmY
MSLDRINAIGHKIEERLAGLPNMTDDLGDDLPDLIERSRALLSGKGEEARRALASLPKDARLVLEDLPRLDDLPRDARRALDNLPKEARRVLEDLPRLDSLPHEARRALDDLPRDARRALEGLAASRAPRGRDPAARVIVGVAIAGVVLGFLLGRSDARQRHMARDRALKMARKALEWAGKMGRNLRNLAQGVAVEGGRLLEPQEVPDEAPDEVLEARVRSALGREARQVRAIEVEVHGGHVKLSGPVQADEHEAAVASVERVRGVSEVEDRLSVQPSEASAQPSDIPAPRASEAPGARSGG